MRTREEWLEYLGAKAPYHKNSYGGMVLRLVLVEWARQGYPEEFEMTYKSFFRRHKSASGHEFYFYTQRDILDKWLIRFKSGGFLKLSKKNNGAGMPSVFTIGSINVMSIIDFYAEQFHQFLGEGKTRDMAITRGKLEVLRQEPASTYWWKDENSVEELLKMPEEIRPDYYRGSSGRDVLDYASDQNLNFWETNVVKYVTRARRKGSEVEDSQKAMTYLQDRIRRLQDHAVQPEPEVKPSPVTQYPEVTEQTTESETPEEEADEEPRISRTSRLQLP